MEANGEFVAYPVTTMKETPVVNDVVGGEPIVLLYDPYHDIGQVYRRNVGGRTLTFHDATPPGGTSLVARDSETGSTWNVSGHALNGPLETESLKPAPHWNQLFWFSWAAFKPGTRLYGQ